MEDKVLVLLSELIEYFEETLKLSISDLVMNDDDRMILVGQLQMLEQIKEINEKGFPTDDGEE